VITEWGTSTADRPPRPQNGPVTTSDGQLELRPSRSARAWEVAFPFVLAGFFFLILRPDGTGQWTLVAAVLALACVQGWRRFRLAAIGTADGRLLVRSLYRDRSLDRRDIAEVGVASRFLSRAVRLRLQDGSFVWLDVTHSGRLEESAELVDAWVRDTRPHTAG
jgi:hypothetical protein